MKLLLPTDGSDLAEKAADFAIDLAKKTEASILFLNVVDEVSPAYAYELESGVSIDINELAESRKKYGDTAVNTLRQKAEDAGVKSETKVIEGHPWEEILAEIDRSGIDQIVIGSHGRRALAAAVLGNVTFNVIHGSPVPVTVVPHHE